MSDEQLLDVFKSFCAFGAGSKDAQPLMDNAKFGKLFRDLKLYDKKFTSTDTDIIFNRPEVKRYAYCLCSKGFGLCLTRSTRQQLSKYFISLLFSSTCSKTERKIGFAGFKKALALCAEKKYGSKEDVQKLIDKICAGKGPVAVGATVSFALVNCLASHAYTLQYNLKCCSIKSFISTRSFCVIIYFSSKLEGVAVNFQLDFTFVPFSRECSLAPKAQLH